MSKVEINQKQMDDISLKSDTTLKFKTKVIGQKKKKNPEFNTFQKLVQDILIVQNHLPSSIPDKVYINIACNIFLLY